MTFCVSFSGLPFLSKAASISGMAVATLGTVARANRGSERAKTEAPQIESPRVNQPTSLNREATTLREIGTVLSAAKNSGNINPVIDLVSKLLPGSTPASVAQVIENFGSSLRQIPGLKAKIHLLIEVMNKEAKSPNASVDSFAETLATQINKLKASTPALNTALVNYANDLMKVVSLNGKSQSQLLNRLDKLGFGNSEVRAKLLAAVLKAMNLNDSNLRRLPELMNQFAPATVQTAALSTKTSAKNPVLAV